MANIFAHLLLIEQMENEERQENNIRLERRLLRDAQNPFDLPDVEFKNNFRLNREAARYLIDFITPFMQHGHGMNTRIPNHLRVFVALYFFSGGSYQRNVGNCMWHNMSQPMVSRSIKEVCNIIVRRLTRNVIKFPRNDPDRANLKLGFVVHHRMRHVIGIVDGSHVAIVKPFANENEHVFVNRKGYHSINVQIICDSKLKILSCNSLYPGSCHDSHIWRHSIAGRMMRSDYDNGDHETRILGDSGYSCLPWLLVPVTNPATAQERRFNTRFKKTRSAVERCIGVLKGRFRCLLKDRTLHYKPPCASRIIVTCAILHNIALRFNVGNPDPMWDPIDLEEQILPPNVADGPNQEIIWRRRGQQARQQYIETYF